MPEDIDFTEQSIKWLREQIRRAGGDDLYRIDLHLSDAASILA